MKYSVSINESKRTITVDLDGHKGVAKCCPTDSFNISTGIELALERAKVAKKMAEAKQNETKPTKMATDMTVTMLAKQLEKVLPKGSMVVAVGGGDGCLTKEGKEWLAKLAGVSCECGCDGDCDCCHEAYDEGYADGVMEGRRQALAYIKSNLADMVEEYALDFAESVEALVDDAEEDMAD